MSHAAEETSTQSGRPVVLIEITLGAEVFRYTKGDHDVTVDGKNWNAIPIRRDNLTLSTEDRDQAKVFQVPGDEEFVANFILSAPSEVPILELYEYHLGDDTDVKRRWAGEVADIDWVENAAWAKITARPVEGGLDARYPRLDDGVLCPYMLYDGNCKVSEASHTYSGTASSVSGDSLVVSGLDNVGAGRPVGWATGGKIRVTSTGEVRMILAHTATDTLQLASPFKDNPNGLGVAVLAGCDRTLATCNTKLSNEDNFGGVPYLPTKSPEQFL